MVDLAPSQAGQDAEKVKELFKILKNVLGAFMLRRTKAKLVESGTLVLPPVTEITVLVSYCSVFLSVRWFHIAIYEATKLSRVALIELEVNSLIIFLICVF